MSFKLSVDNLATTTAGNSSAWGTACRENRSHTTSLHLPSIASMTVHLCYIQLYQYNGRAGKKVLRCKVRKIICATKHRAQCSKDMQEEFPMTKFCIFLFTPCFLMLYRRSRIYVFVNVLFHQLVLFLDSDWLNCIPSMHFIIPFYIVGEKQ